MKDSSPCRLFFFVRFMFGMSSFLSIPAHHASIKCSSTMYMKTSNINLTLNLYLFCKIFEYLLDGTINYVIILLYITFINFERGQTQWLDRKATLSGRQHLLMLKYIYSIQFNSIRSEHQDHLIKVNKKIPGHKHSWTLPKDLRSISGINCN